MKGDGSVRIGLVLGAGGVPGGFFIRGAIAAIGDRTGWVPAMCATVIGTSAGALNAARIDPTPLDVPAEVADALVALASKVPPPPRTAADRVLAQPRQLAGRAVGRFAPTGRNAADYPVAQGPFHPAVHAVSCRRSTGERRVTRLAEAADPSAELYASAAIPGYAKPVVIDGSEYVDGAVWSTTNADLVRAKDHDLLIVIAPMVPVSGGSVVQRGHRGSLLTELAPWQGRSAVVSILPTPDALERRDDHEAFGRIELP